MGRGVIIESFRNTSMSKECLVCGITFSKKEDISKQAWENRKFCSLKCASHKKKDKPPVFRGFNTTYCRSGKHLWIEENILINSRGHKNCKLCKMERPKKSYPHCPDKKKDEKLRRMYKITLEEYNEMLFKQKYSCKICGKKGEELKKGLSVDHNHETGEVRGLLCTNCNTALGSFKDDIELMKKGINYLRKYKNK